MNLAQKFEQQGFRRGIERGIDQGRRQALLDLVPSVLLLRFGPLDPPTRDRVAAADLETLQRWADRAMHAPSLADLLDG